MVRTKIDNSRHKAWPSSMRSPLLLRFSHYSIQLVLSPPLLTHSESPIHFKIRCCLTFFSLSLHPNDLINNITQHKTRVPTRNVSLSLFVLCRFLSPLIESWRVSKWHEWEACCMNGRWMKLIIRTTCCALIFHHHLFDIKIIIYVFCCAVVASSFFSSFLATRKNSALQAIIIISFIQVFLHDSYLFPSNFSYDVDSREAVNTCWSYKIPFRRSWARKNCSRLKNHVYNVKHIGKFIAVEVEVLLKNLWELRMKKFEQGIIRKNWWMNFFS